MKRAVTGDGAAALERLSKRVAAWRERREHPGSRVPEELWRYELRNIKLLDIYGPVGMLLRHRG